MSVVGKTYYERGKPVTVLIRWREFGKQGIKTLTEDEAEELQLIVEAGIGTSRVGGPRNVLIRREDGELVVRPFRGLRRSVPDERTP